MGSECNTCHTSPSIDFRPTSPTIDFRPALRRTAGEPLARLQLLLGVLVDVLMEVRSVASRWNPVNRVGPTQSPPA